MGCNEKSSTHAVGKKYNFTWQQVMLRIQDPKTTLEYYKKHFGMHLIYTYNFSKLGFSLYFLEAPLTSKFETSETYLWSMPGICLELCYNHNSKEDTHVSKKWGNAEFFPDFQCITFKEQAPDTVCDAFNTQLNHSIVTLKDPNGYRIETVKSNSDMQNLVSPTIHKNYLASITLRVKDAIESVTFYTDMIGMTQVNSYQTSDSTYYELEMVGNAKTDNLNDPKTRLKLEYVHKNAENSESLTPHENEEFKGFGHIGFLTDNLEMACEELERLGVKPIKRPQEGKMRGIAFYEDPNGYWIEIIQRNVRFEQS